MYALRGQQQGDGMGIGTWLAIGTAAMVVMMVIILPMVQSKRAAARYKAEREAEIKAEADRIAALPKLDTSHMLEIPMTLAQIEESRNIGGTFGNRYAHMLVTDRDGRKYFCLMTAYNHAALHRSRFVQASYTPYLHEGLDHFDVDGVRFGVYPNQLREYPRDSQIWRRWAKLRREFDEMEVDYFKSFFHYFDNGRPRDLSQSNAA